VVRDPRAHLVRVVTRQALNRLRHWHDGARTTSANGAPGAFDTEHAFASQLTEALRELRRRDQDG
jgi:type II secretory pathway component GspD/PulD (secretin)